MPKVKVILQHPITHDGIEYGRGEHEVEEYIAQLWEKNASHALAPAELRRRGETKRAPDAATGAAPSGVKPDMRTNDMTAKDAIELVQASDDLDELKALEAGEQLHPATPGGRRSVNDAIAKQIKTLSQ